METYLKIKYYAQVFRRKVVKIPIKNNIILVQWLRNRNTASLSPAGGNRKRKNKKRKKLTLLIPVEQCRKGELQLGTSRREWGCCAGRREVLLLRGRCDAGPKHGVTTGPDSAHVPAGARSITAPFPLVFGGVFFGHL